MHGDCIVCGKPPGAVPHPFVLVRAGSPQYRFCSVSCLKRARGESHCPYCGDYVRARLFMDDPGTGADRPCIACFMVAYLALRARALVGGDTE